jgi:hypothetical protein
MPFVRTRTELFVYRLFPIWSPDEREIILPPPPHLHSQSHFQNHCLREWPSAYIVKLYAGTLLCCKVCFAHKTLSIVFTTVHHTNWILSCCIDFTVLLCHFKPFIYQDLFLGYKRVLSHLYIVIDILNRVPCVLFPIPPHHRRNHLLELQMTGGGVQTMKFTSVNLKPYIYNFNHLAFNQARLFTYVAHLTENCVQDFLSRHLTCIACIVPLPVLCEGLKCAEFCHAAEMHRIWLPRRMDIFHCRELLCAHVCLHCPIFVSIFRASNLVEMPPVVQPPKKIHSKPEANAPTNEHTRSQPLERPLAVSGIEQNNTVCFPPTPPSDPLLNRIVNDFCADLQPAALEETGCAVCGQLKLLVSLKPLSCVQGKLSLLPNNINITRKERFKKEDPVEALDGPPLAHMCDKICPDCETSLTKNKVPTNSLANYLWIGEVPAVLSILTYAERMMVTCIRHNRCVVRVNSGRGKMTSNAVMFSTPIIQVYRKLPPSPQEINDVLAFIFTGPCQPMEADFERTPMLVRQKIVKQCLDWM